MGLTLKQYISMQRVAKACELLVDHADWKIAAIARRTGFRYFADFNRVFKQYAGITAAAYRAEHAM